MREQAFVTAISGRFLNPRAQFFCLNLTDVRSITSILEGSLHQWLMRESVKNRYLRAREKPRIDNQSTSPAYLSLSSYHDLIQSDQCICRLIIYRLVLSRQQTCESEQMDVTVYSVVFVVQEVLHVFPLTDAKLRAEWELCKKLSDNEQPHWCKHSCCVPGLTKWQCSKSSLCHIAKSDLDTMCDSLIQILRSKGKTYSSCQHCLTRRILVFLVSCIHYLCVNSI